MPVYKRDKGRKTETDKWEESKTEIYCIEYL